MHETRETLMDSSPKHPHHHHHRRLWRCAAITFVALLVLGALLAVLGATVLRVRNPITTVNSVRLVGVHAGLDVADRTVELNITLELSITAANPNQADFKYTDGTAELYYRKVLIGEAAIPPGEVAAEGTEETDVLLTMLGDRMIADSALYSDVVSGSVLFTTYTRIPGRVTVLGIIRHHLVAYSMCEVVVDVINQSIQNTDCKSQIEL